MINICGEELEILFTETHTSAPGRISVTTRKATYVLKTSKHTAKEYDALWSAIVTDFPEMKKSRVEYDRTKLSLVLHPCPSATFFISEDEYRALKARYKDHLR